MLYILYLSIDKLDDSLNDFSHVAKIRNNLKSQWSDSP